MVDVCCCFKKLMIDGCAVLWGLAYFLEFEVTVETVKEAYQRFFSL